MITLNLETGKEVAMSYIAIAIEFIKTFVNGVKLLIKDIFNLSLVEILAIHQMALLFFAAIAMPIFVLMVVVNLFSISFTASVIAALTTLHLGWVKLFACCHVLALFGYLSSEKENSNEA